MSMSSSSAAAYEATYWREETLHTRELLATATEQLRMARVALAMERIEHADTQRELDACSDLLRDLSDLSERAQRVSSEQQSEPIAF